MLTAQSSGSDQFSSSRIRLNKAYLKLGARNPDQAEVELLMRRKEFLDEVHQVQLTLVYPFYVIF
jgi:hypothetical protein